MQFEIVYDVVHNSTMDATYIKKKQIRKQSWILIWISHT